MMIRIFIKDRLDRIHFLLAEEGELLSNFLKRKYIPSSAIIAYINDVICDDQMYVLNKEDKIVLEMVRAYQLPEYCRILRL